MYTDIYIETPYPEPTLLHSFSRALRLNAGLIKLGQGGDDLPDLDQYRAVVDLWPIKGVYALRASVYGDTEEAEEDVPSDEEVCQSLADELGCAVCLQIDDPDPWKYMRFRPHAPHDLVSVDLSHLDDNGTMSVRPYANQWANDQTDLVETVQDAPTA